jgi:hypothetical protein
LLKKSRKNSGVQTARLDSGSASLRASLVAPLDVIHSRFGSILDHQCGLEKLGDRPSAFGLEKQGTDPARLAWGMLALFASTTADSIRKIDWD